MQYLLTDAPKYTVRYAWLVLNIRYSLYVRINWHHGAQDFSLVCNSDKSAINLMRSMTKTYASPTPSMHRCTNIRSILSRVKLTLHCSKWSPTVCNDKQGSGGSFIRRTHSLDPHPCFFTASAADPPTQQWDNSHASKLTAPSCVRSQLMATYTWTSKHLLAGYL